VVEYLERSPDYLTAKEIASKQRVSIDFVRAALRAGTLKGHTIGGRGDWRVSTEDYERWLAAGAPGAPSKPKASAPDEHRIRTPEEIEEANQVYRETERKWRGGGSDEPEA
jgi:excisionase family DNA binding protein